MRGRQVVGDLGATRARRCLLYTSTEVDLGGPLNDSGSVRGRVVGVMADRGFFYENANQKTGLFYGIGEVDLGPDTVLSAGLHYSRVRSHPPPSMGGLPRYKDGAPLGLRRSRCV